MKKSIAFLFAVLTILSLAPSVMAQDVLPDAAEVAEIIITFIFGPGMPPEWYTWQKIMQFVIFPFIALFAVFYALMEELHIFRTDAGKNAQKVIGIVMAFIAGKTMLATIRGFLMVNAVLATFGFGLILFFGIFFWLFRTGLRHTYGGYKGVYDEYKSIQLGIADLQKELLKLRQQKVGASPAQKAKITIEEKKIVEKIIKKMGEAADKEKKMG